VIVAKVWVAGARGASDCSGPIVTVPGSCAFGACLVPFTYVRVNCVICTVQFCVDPAVMASGAGQSGIPPVGGGTPATGATAPGGISVPPITPPVEVVPPPLPGATAGVVVPPAEPGTGGTPQPSGLNVQPGAGATGAEITEAAEAGEEAEEEAALEQPFFGDDIPEVVLHDGKERGGMLKAEFDEALARVRDYPEKVWVFKRAGGPKTPRKTFAQAWAYVTSQPAEAYRRSREIGTFYYKLSVHSAKAELGDQWANSRPLFGKYSKVDGYREELTMAGTGAGERLHCPVPVPTPVTLTCLTGCIRVCSVVATAGKISSTLPVNSFHDYTLTELQYHTIRDWCRNNGGQAHVLDAGAVNGFTSQ
jgi:hypothetical protein